MTRHTGLLGMIGGLLVLLVLLAGWIVLRDLPALAPAASAAGPASPGGPAASPVATPGSPEASTGAAAAAESGRRLRGVFHVHSDSSHDGRTPAAEQLAAAGRLGLDFVIYAEHNRQPVHASPRGGPLAVPGTELSTVHGHIAFLGSSHVPEDDERRLIGLVDSLNARGALTILTHPSSPRRPWTGRLAGIGGLEIASTSTDARVKADPFVGILPGLLALPLNPELALAQLYRRDERSLGIWDDREDPAVIGICGVDAHGWVDAELNFRTWQVVFDPWPEAPVPLDAEALVDRLATGRFACVAGLVADAPPRFSFTAVGADGALVHQGSTASARGVEALRVEAPHAARDGEPGAVTTVLLRDGEEVARTRDGVLRHPDPGPGTYRVEVRLRIPGVFVGGRDVPVIYSNRIRLTD